MHNRRVSGNDRRALNYVSDERRETVVLDDNPMCEVEQERRKQSWNQCFTRERKKMAKVVTEKEVFTINEWVRPSVTYDVNISFKPAADLAWVTMAPQTRRKQITSLVASTSRNGSVRTFSKNCD